MCIPKPIISALGGLPPPYHTYAPPRFSPPLSHLLRIIQPCVYSNSNRLLLPVCSGPPTYIGLGLYRILSHQHLSAYPPRFRPRTYSQRVLHNPIVFFCLSALVLLHTYVGSGLCRILSHHTFPPQTCILKFQSPSFASLLWSSYIHRIRPLSDPITPHLSAPNVYTQNPVAFFCLSALHT